MKIRNAEDPLHKLTYPKNFNSIIMRGSKKSMLRIFYPRCTFCTASRFVCTLDFMSCTRGLWRSLRAENSSNILQFVRIYWRLSVDSALMLLGCELMWAAVETSDPSQIQTSSPSNISFWIARWVWLNMFFLCLFGVFFSFAGCFFSTCGGFADACWLQLHLEESWKTEKGRTRVFLRVRGLKMSVFYL